jgi:hypothetical protein
MIWGMLGWYPLFLRYIILNERELVMSVSDHGIEAIRKSAEEIIPGDKKEYRIRTSSVGVFQLSGLSKAMRVTTMSVGDVAIKLPAIPLADRNSLIIYNKSATDTIFMGPLGVTADTVTGITSGWEIDPLTYYSLDIQDDIEVYGICEAGKSAIIKLMELA